MIMRKKMILIIINISVFVTLLDSAAVSRRILSPVRPSVGKNASGPLLKQKVFYAIGHLPFDTYLNHQIKRNAVLRAEWIECDHVVVITLCG
jgi:hypothetical protein